MNAKKSASLLLILILTASLPSPAHASPWAAKKTYGGKTGGKLLFGLKHSLFSWTAWWTESREPQYKREWQGFAVGIGKTVTYTAAGLIQLVTFPIPVDFPDIGIGLHIPNKNCPLRHSENTAPSGAEKTPVPAASLAPKDSGPLKG